jgi:hypothetical protein
MIKLKWHEEIPDNVLELEQLVIQDLVRLHEDLEKKPSSLFFHTVFVTEDPDGPIVQLWGEDDDDVYYHCKYNPDPLWETFQEQNLKDLFKEIDNSEKEC